MSIKNGRDYLELVWKDPKSKRRYVVGELSRNGQFEFSYANEVHAAIDAGFELLIAFPDIDKTYKNENLFPVFASRLPDPKRKGIEAILKKYGVSEYDAYKLLKSSGARLPIDNLEFIDPIFDLESEKVVRNFYVAGTGFCLGCEGSSCKESIEVQLNEELRLEPEPKNRHDQHAIRITNNVGALLGYLPRYYAKGVSQLMRNNVTITCKAIEINKTSECLECIKVELTIEKDKNWSTC